MSVIFVPAEENPVVKSMSAEMLMHFFLFLVLILIRCWQNEFAGLASCEL